MLLAHFDANGHDNSSKHTLDEALEVAQRNLVTVYGVSTQAYGFNNPDEKNLIRLAEETGGRVEYPLNNRRWLKERFANIRQLRSEPERVAALNEIVHWTDPGPGGFYDDLGNPARQPHLGYQYMYRIDSRFRGPRMDHATTNRPPSTATDAV